MALDGAALGANGSSQLVVTKQRRPTRSKSTFVAWPLGIGDIAKLVRPN